MVNNENNNNHIDFQLGLEFAEFQNVNSSNGHLQRETSVAWNIKNDSKQNSRTIIFWINQFLYHFNVLGLPFMLWN